MRVRGASGYSRRWVGVSGWIPGVLVFLLFAARAVGGPPVLPEPQDAKRSLSLAQGDELHNLEELWEIAGQTEKKQLALRFAEEGIQAAAPLMRNCLEAKEHPLTPACITALVALDQVQVVPEIRNKLRESLDAALIVPAAMAIGHWRDQYSSGLLLGTMMQALGGAAGSLAALHAFLRLQAPHSTSYLRWILNTSPYRAVQAACAMHLVGRLDRRHRSRLFLTMKELMSQALLLPGWTTEDLATAEFCVEGFNRGERAGCRMLRDIAEALAQEPLPCRAEKLRWVLQRTNRECLGSWRSSLSATVADAVEQMRRKPIAHPLPISQYALLLLEESDGREESRTTNASNDLRALRFQDEKGSYQYGEGAVEAHRVLLSHLEAGSEQRWSRNKQRRLVRRKGVRIAFPPSYSENFPELEQPAWYPKGIHITIDDGPRLARLKLILDVLDEFGVKATFFFIGHNILSRFLDYPTLTRQILQRLVNGGHVIGYHSMDHRTQVSTHIMNLEPEQIEDDVRVFHWVLTWVLQGPYPLFLGRTPGGMGMSFENLKEGFYLGGLRAPLGWNAGDDHWPPGSKRSVVRFLARSYLRKQRKKPVTILLHETKNLHKELRVFLKEIHDYSHADRPSQSASRRGK